MQRSVMAVVESPGLSTSRSLQRAKVFSGQAGDVISPKVPGLCLEQPSPVAAPLLFVVTATTVAVWGHCRGFSSCCNSISRHIPVLSPLCYTTSSGVHPVVTPESTDVPSVAWQPFPAGEIPQPDPPSAPGEECNGTIRMQVGRILHSHKSHSSACVCHPGFHTYNFSLSVSLPIQTLLSKNVPHPRLHPRWQQTPPVAITTSSSPAKSARPATFPCLHPNHLPRCEHTLFFLKSLPSACKGEIAPFWGLLALCTPQVPPFPSVHALQPLSWTTLTVLGTL